jgi:hypothetical protein
MSIVAGLVPAIHRTWRWRTGSRIDLPDASREISILQKNIFLPLSVNQCV